MNKKRILLALSSGAVAVTLIPMFAAFEAHVINVTAKIENALAVSTDAIDFGTVFPQEHLEQPLTIRLSGSFMDEDRVDDVEYFIRQKPKCAITNIAGTEMLDDETKTGHIILEQGQARIDCGAPPRPLVTGEVWGVLPSLCPYISKEDDQSPDNDGSLASFHKPWTIVGSSTIDWNDTLGRLTKIGNDTVDNWTIDLAVPCFGDHCAQDWADFVGGINPDADPDDYVLDIDDQHKIFGCDLWVEVSGVSLSDDEPEPEDAQLVVRKAVINDNGGNNVAADFQLTVDGGNVTSGATTTFSAGVHVVSETGVSGYAASFSGDCDSDGDVTLVAGQTKVCIVTNNDIAPTITLIKNVVNDGPGTPGTATAADFTLRIDGAVVPNNTSVSVSANAAHAINEDAKTGYGFTGISGSLECPAVLGGTATLDEGESITCTITNNDNPQS